MQLSELVQKIAEEFEDTPKEQITATTKLKDLEEWSSMQALIIIALIDNHYDVILTGEEMIDAQTPTDIYNIILQKRPNN